MRDIQSWFRKGSERVAEFLKIGKNKIRISKHQQWLSPSRHLVPCGSQLIRARPGVAGGAVRGAGQQLASRAGRGQAPDFQSAVLPPSASGHQGSLAFRRGRLCPRRPVWEGTLPSTWPSAVSLGRLRSWTGRWKGSKKRSHSVLQISRGSLL